MTKKKMTTSSPSTKNEFLAETNPILDLDLLKKLSSPTSRATLQNLQTDFDETADRPFFLFFQRFLGEYSKYAWPKTLSATHRNSRVFKVTKLHNCLRLRYMTIRCQNCCHYFTLFNTTKPFHEWESEKLPQISKKLWENKRINLCTDCLYMADVIA